MAGKHRPQLTDAARPATFEVEAYNERDEMVPTAIAGEHPLTLYLDKREIVTLMTLGHAPEALAIGYLRNQRLADSINVSFGEGTASALDGSSIIVQAPTDAGQKVAFVSALESLEVDPAEAAARIIVNSRTGTVVIGAHVIVDYMGYFTGTPAAPTIGTPPVNPPPPPIAPEWTLDVPKIGLRSRVLAA